MSDDLPADVFPIAQIGDVYVFNKEQLSDEQISEAHGVVNIDGTVSVVSQNFYKTLIAV